MNPTEDIEMPTSLTQRQFKLLTRLATEVLEIRAEAVREGAFDGTLGQLAALLSEVDNDVNALRRRVIPDLRRHLAAGQRAHGEYRLTNLKADQERSKLIERAFALVAEAGQLEAQIQQDKVNQKSKIERLMGLGATLEEAQRIAGPLPEYPHSKESLLAESKALIERATAILHQKATQVAHPYSVEAGWVRGYGVFSGLDVTEQLPSPKPHC